MKILIVHVVFIPLSSCATALVLLAEEEATTIVDAEKKFRQALKIAEANFKRSQALQHHSPPHEKIHSKSLLKVKYDIMVFMSG